MGAEGCSVDGLADDTVPDIGGEGGSACSNGMAAGVLTPGDRAVGSMGAVVPPAG